MPGPEFWRTLQAFHRITRTEEHEQLNVCIAENHYELRKAYEIFNPADWGASIWLFRTDHGSPGRYDPGVFSASSNPLCLPLEWHMPSPPVNFRWAKDKSDANLTLSMIALLVLGISLVCFNSLWNLPPTLPED